MGLDQYLFKIDKENFDKLSRARQLEDEYESRITALYAEKYKESFDKILGEDCTVDEETLSQELKDELKDLRAKFAVDEKAIADELGLIANSYGYAQFPEKVEYGSELAYWRKNWPLHSFIVDNFWNKAKDNVVDIPLTVENIEKIIDWATARHDDYTVETFQDALSLAKDNKVIYYHPWY